MAKVIKLTFNPFQENTYIVYDDSKECVIFDPGCYTTQEQQQLVAVLNQYELKPVRLINTHCHLDHIFGNRFIADTYQLPLEIHRGELPVLEAAPQSAMLFGISFPPDKLSPSPAKFLEAGETVEFGHTSLDILFTPGHSPASISFFCAADRFLIAGDVLFYESIGRTDLPGGDFDTLMQSIVQQLFPLGDDVVVYAGHGPETSIGYEKRHNPFVSGF